MARKQHDPHNYPLPSQDALLNFAVSNAKDLRQFQMYLRDVPALGSVPPEEQLQPLLARYQRRWTNGIAYRKAWLIFMGVISALIFLSYPSLGSLVTAFFCAVLPISVIFAVNEANISLNRAAWQRYYAEYQRVLANLWLPENQPQTLRQDAPEWVELDDAPHKSKRG